MSFTYTNNLKLALPVSGTEAGTWGDAVNNQITSLVDQSISGTVSLTSMTDADYTLSNGNGNAANEARYMAFLVPSSLTLTAARNIIVPSTSKTYLVKNATTGGFSVTVKTSAGTGIEVPNGREMLLYCDATNVIMAFDTVNVTTVNGGPLAGLRNRVINGAMKIDQRNQGGAQTISSSTPPVAVYSIDRMLVASAGSGTITGQQITSGAENRYRFTGGAGNLGAQLIQRIEAANCMDMAGKTATLSVKLSSSSLTSVTWNVYYATTANTFGTLASPTKTSIANGTFTISSTEATYSVQIAIPSAATTGIEINLTGGSLGAAATFTLGDLQFELGSVATPLEQRPYGMELALCQRYYYRVGSNTYLSANSQVTNSTGLAVIPFLQPMRTAPSALEQIGGNGSILFANTSTGCTSAPTFGVATTNGATIQWTATSGHTAGQAGLYFVAVGANSLGWSAEL